MRIGINAQLLAFTENYRQAGLSRYIYELVQRLPRIDQEDQFTAFAGNAPIPQSFARDLPPNVRLSRSRLPTANANVRIGWEQAVLPLASMSAKLDLLHCPVNVRPVVSPCPVIITVHDLIFLLYPQNFKPAKRRYLKAMTTWSARHAAHVIAVSEATRQDVVKLLGVDPEKVTTVHNGVGDQFKPVSEEEKRTFAEQKGLRWRVILYVGTLEPRKNLTTLLEAFSQIANDTAFDDTTLVIGGSKGWYYDEIFAAAKRLGLLGGGRVRFPGRVPDEELPLWYNIATVFAYPSLYEGFGLPALEAMACGTPVLTSDTSCFPEVVGQAGIMLNPTDTAAWTDGLRRVLVDSDLRCALSAKGLDQAGQFSWDRAARETVQIYRDVLSTRHSDESLHGIPKY